MSGHRPERFKEYFELPDKSGFTIKGSQHVFRYELDGGWRDENGHCYDANGDPVYSESEGDVDDYNSYDGREWSDYGDEYEKQYGPGQGQAEDLDNPHDQSAKILEKVAQNLAELEKHPKGEPLRVEFEILDIQSDEPEPSLNELYLSYSKKVSGIIDVFYEDDEKDEDAVVGYFVMNDSQAAQRLIQMEAENVVGSDLTFSVEPFEELKVDPLSKEELKGRGQMFVQVDESSRLYIVSVEGGFRCKAKEFNEWLRGLGLQKHGYEVIKMKKTEEGGKAPIMKIKEDNITKVRGACFEGQEVKLLEYVPKKHPEEMKEGEEPKEESKEEEAKEEEPKEKESKEEESKEEEA